MFENWRNPMRRRDLLALIGGAAAWPAAAARAQAQAVPVIGFLNSASPAAFARLVEAFHQGLGDEGYVEGRNVAIEYRWAEGHIDRLEGQAAELARRGVSLIAATGGVPAARAAKSATATIPILFISGVDPVRAKLVESINRPGGNATGITVITSEMVAKRLELLRELAPRVRTVVMFQNISKPYTTEFDQEFVAQVESKEAESAARTLGLQPVVLDAARDGDLQAGLETAVKNGADALFVSADAYFTDRRDQIVALAARYGLPAIYPWRQYAMAGGLASYGPNIADAYRQIGRFAGRILKGAKPETIPVQEPDTFELVINLKAAKALGLTVSPWLLAAANETIE
jgi:putative ABC transport system substrate-binding protein